MQTNPSLMRDESGIMTSMAVILMVAFVGILAVVVDLGHLHTVQNELRNAADACALRGARSFVPDDLTGMTPMAPDWERAKREASSTIANNKSDVNGVMKALTDLPTTDMQVGVWNCETQDWVGGTPATSPWPPDSTYWGHAVGPAISLPTQKGPNYNAGPVTMTMANVFGIPTVPVKAKATGWLSPIGGFTPDSGLPLPFGAWPDSGTDSIKPGKTIIGKFNNDVNDTLGWTNLDPNNTNPNVSQIRKLLTGVTQSVDVPSGSPIGIQNGVASSLIQTMVAKDNRFGLVETTPNFYTPDAGHVNSIYMIPLYTAPTQADKFNHSSVTGATTVRIVSVSGPPDNQIVLEVVGGSYSVPGYGGDHYYGILSNVPKLVK